MGRLRAHLDVVCHQVRLPENLGAIARLCANFDFPRIILSDAEVVSHRDAERVAVGAESVLRGLRLVPTLPEAVGDCVFVLGTTGREKVRGRRVVSPEEAVGQLWQQAARGRVALLLGGEQRGLSDDELEQCHAICVIPTSEVQPSMNLAQAASVLLYLCARADDERPSSLHEGPPPEAGARLSTVQALEARMQDVLLRAEFLNPEAPAHILRELSRSLVKGQLSQREAELWLAAFAHLGRRCT